MTATDSPARIVEATEEVVSLLYQLLDSGTTVYDATRQAARYCADKGLLHDILYTITLAGLAEYANKHAKAGREAARGYGAGTWPDISGEPLALPRRRPGLAVDDEPLALPRRRDVWGYAAQPYTIDGLQLALVDHTVGRVRKHYPRLMGYVVGTMHNVALFAQVIEATREHDEDVVVGDVVSVDTINQWGQHIWSTADVATLWKQATRAMATDAVAVQP